MSKVAIVGDASGTGTFTISAPNGNTDRTLVLPDEAGTVLTSASNVAQKGVPAFRVTNVSDQTITTGVETKVVLNSVDFNYGGYFDSTTNYRYTPLVAGVYQFNGVVTSDSDGGTITRFAMMITKNGTLRRYSDTSISGSGAFQVASGSVLMYMNGTTDYVELYGYAIGTGTLSIKAVSTWATEFSGVLVRAD